MLRIKELREDNDIKQSKIAELLGIQQNSYSQIENEKIILSVAGEKKAKELSELKEFDNIDAVWSSSYTRAIATAKYIANRNNLPINIDSNFNERKLGDLKALEKLGEGKKHTYTEEQLLDENLKNIDGENRLEVNQRMTFALNHILKENIGKKIAIVSHGAAIKFLLMNWCELNKDREVIYDGTILNIESPSVIKLQFIRNRAKRINYYYLKYNSEYRFSYN